MMMLKIIPTNIPAKNSIILVILYYHLPHFLQPIDMPRAQCIPFHFWRIKSFLDLLCHNSNHSRS